MRNTPLFLFTSLFVSFFAATLGSSPALASPAPVVGGSEAKRGEFPDVVAILGADGSLCSGTLLGADFVLTAGHCIETNPVEVIIGSVDLAKPDGERRAVKWSRAYPNWIERYDVGVVMLENPVFAKQRAIAQGCTTRYQLDTGYPVEVVGFGLTTASGTGDNTRLHHATVPIMDPTCSSDPACAPAIAPGGEFTAGGRDADSCFGDSGGPVYIYTAQGYALLGIVSRGLTTFGAPCQGGGVYVRADKVVAWVQSITDRKIDRVPCDLPTDDGREPGATDEDALEPGGCNAGAGAGMGVVQGSLLLYYAAVVVLGLRRRRMRHR